MTPSCHRRQHPNEVLISTIRHERRKEQAPTVEEPLVVLMASLDAERVRRFAAAKGAPNLDAFMAEIEAANLWRFARRPLDLDWLVQFWRSHGRLGTLAEMLESSLTERLNETNLTGLAGTAWTLLGRSRRLSGLGRLSCSDERPLSRFPIPR